MKNRWGDEIVRLLNNWAMWQAGGSNGGESSFPAYRLAAPGPRFGNVMPVLSGEAEDVNKVILTLQVRYQQPLRMHYCWPGRSDRSKALACNCCLNTYKSRLDDAHYLFAQAWYRRNESTGRQPAQAA
jgi:hypothetical protein